jgi:hypothetical protein
MKRYKLMKISFSRTWYNAIYKDVYASGLNPKLHFNSYGMMEKRFQNPMSFLNQFNNSFYFRNLVISTLFNLAPKLKSQRIAKLFFDYCLKLEVSKIKKYKFRNLCIVPFLKDGVAEASKLYISTLSSSEELGVLKALDHTSGAEFQPMVLEFWSNGKLLDKIPLIFPAFSLYEYSQTCTKIEQIYIQHIFQIEAIVEYFLLNYNSKFTFFIHDFYLLTTKYHLFDEFNEKKYSLDYAFIHFPNKKIDFNLFLNSVSKFICPSKFVYDKYKRYIPREKLDWNYPPEITNIEDLPVQEIYKQDIFNVLIIGHLGKYKGSSIISNLKNTFEKERLPYRFLHFGRNALFENDDYYLNIPNMNRDELLDECRKLPISFAFLPFQVDETYSFTLSDVFLLQLPLIVSKVGATSERCLKRNLTLLIDPDSTERQILESFNRLVSAHKNKCFNNSTLSNELKLKRQRILDSVLK